MAVADYLDTIQKAYIAFYQRPADPDGLKYWAEEVDNAGGDLNAVIDAFGNSAEAASLYGTIDSNTIGDVIDSIYQALFGRAPDAAGKQFYIDGFNAGTFSAASLAMNVIDGATGQDAVAIANKLDAANNFTNTLDAEKGGTVDAKDYAGNDDAAEARDWLAAVTDVSGSRASAQDAKEFVETHIQDGVISPDGDGPVFTLTENYTITDLPDSTPTQKVIYWGYNPHGHDETGVDNTDGNDAASDTFGDEDANASGNQNNLTNEGPLDGGVPLSELLSYITALGNDDDGLNDLVDFLHVIPSTNNAAPFSQVTSIDLSADATSTGNATAGSLTVDYVAQDGDAATATLQLDDYLMNFLSSLLLDEEGNSRLYEVEVAYQVQARDNDGNLLTDSDGNPILVDYVIDGGKAIAITPVILTTDVNNGGTEEVGFTSYLDDTIVAARLDLLHGAYINAGTGNNSLEIDAKGHFAQPKALLNIQDISIQNLPNVYTLAESPYSGGDDNFSNYPDVVTGSQTAGDNNSIIDLSRAIDLETLTITSGSFDNLDTNQVDDHGALTVSGVRGGATVTVEGNWSSGDNLHIDFGHDTVGNGVNLVLSNVVFDSSADLQIGQNSPTLNIESTGGHNYIENGFLSSSSGLINLNVTGDAKLVIEESIADDFTTGHPATIDASGNTAGVDLNMDGFTDELVFIGTANSDDHLDASGASGAHSVTVTGGNGNGEYNVSANGDVRINAGDGANEIRAVSNGTNSNNELEDDVFVTVGNGQNDIEVSSSDAFHIVAGNGDNVIVANGAGTVSDGITENDTSTISVGDGDNQINFGSGSSAVHNLTVDAGEGNNRIEGYAASVTVTAQDGNNSVDIDGVSGSATVTTGSGNDTIEVTGTQDDSSSATINAGDGNNSIAVDDLASVSITTGTGNDSVIIEGGDVDLGSANGSSNVQLAGENGMETLININVGEGENTIQMGVDDATNNGVTALEGSTISGSNITLKIETTTDLTRATLDGITAVVLTDDRAAAGSNQGTVQAGGVLTDSLTILDSQLASIGLSNVSVVGASFGATGTLNVVITENSSMDDILGGVEPPAGVKFSFLINDGVTFTLSAEQLHKYVNVAGIGANDANGYADNQVILTDAGPDFNAFFQENGGVGGGTLVNDGAGAGTGGQGANPNGTAVDATIIRELDGFERPAETPFSDTLTLNSDNTPVVGNVSSAFTTTLNIEGAADLDLGSVSLAQGFTVDFSAFTGNFTNGPLTISNFQLVDNDQNDNLNPADVVNSWGNVVGRGDDRVNVEVVTGSVTGYNDITDGGIHSTGVGSFIVTELLDATGSIQSQAATTNATLFVCDATQGLDTVGLQNNRMATVTFEQLNWGQSILMEGDGYANSSDQEKNLGDPDKSEVGMVIANYFEPGANADVLITNQGTTLGLNEDAEDGYDANGERVLDVYGITVHNADRLKIDVQDGDAVIRDVTGVDVEHVRVTGPEDVTIVLNAYAAAAINPTNPLLSTYGSGLDTANDLKTIDGSGVTDTFNITTTASYNFSAVTLTSVDVITLAGLIGTNTLTLNGAQALEFASKIVDANAGAAADLVVVNYNGEDIDFTTIDVDTVSDVTFADVATTINVGSNVNFDGADLNFVANASNTTVAMTYAQYTSSDTANVTVTEMGGNAVTVELNALPMDQTTPVALGGLAGADLVLNVTDQTATSTFDLDANAGDTVTLNVNGNVDLTAGDLTGANIDNVVINAGATLTITAAQAATIGIADVNMDGVADNWSGTGTLNITQMSTQSLDLNDVAATGITVGTVTIQNTDAAIAIDPATTFGGATVVTPTASAGTPDFGTESTTVTMSVDQFASTSGTISGDSQINLTGLYNNVDTNSDFTPDSANWDLSNIANAGTITFSTDTQANVAGNQHFITLTDTASLGGFEIILGAGDLIRFATEAQAAAKVTVDGLASPTGVQWLWTDFTAAVDTANYDSDITTLYIDEALLVSQPREEDLWTTLDGSIDVEKINGDTIPELLKIDRVNIFEALTNIATVNYDDNDEFTTVAALTMNLEGEVNIGEVLLGDTANGNGSTPNIDGVGYLQSVVINSYLDLENVDGYNPAINGVPGLVIAQNTLGNISLNTGSVDELVNVTINTFANVDNIIGTGDDALGYLDQTRTSVDGVVAAAERDGLAIQTGTISFEGNTAKDANLDLNGANNIALGGVDISDANVSLLNIDASGHTGTLTIGGIAPAGGLNAFTYIYVVDGHTTAVGDPNTDFGDAGNNLLVVNGGDNNLTNAATADIDAVHITANGTLTLTEAQVQAIGEGNFTVAAGVTSVTLNVTGVPNGSDIDLNTIQAAGFNIGVVSTADANVTLADGATLGGADELQVTLDDNDRTLTITATQYLQINNGNITENDTDLVTSTTPNKASVTITDTSTASNATAITNPNGDARVSVNLDLTTVATTGTHTLQIADAGTAADVTFDNTSDLAGFIVVLDDIDDANQGNGAAGDETGNEMAGQTVRFTTEAQAGRTITVTGYDVGVAEGAGFLADSEADTNVVWDFGSTTGPINTSNYDANLGRLWVSDVLVTSNNDLEDLFSASDLNGNSLQDDINLNSSIIVRIVNTQDLALIDFASQATNRTIEVEAYTNLSGTGLVSDEQDPLVDIRNLTLDLGGEVMLGNLVIDNVIQTTNTNLDSDQFGTLTINSMLANMAGHYLLPEDFVVGTNVFPTGVNVIGDISAGTTRNELDDIVVNATEVGLTINEIFFAEATAGATANFTANGGNNVTVKSFDMTDPEMTILNVVNNLLGGVLTVTGGSPGVDGGDGDDNTETVNVSAGNAGTTTFGSAKAAPSTDVWAGFAGAELTNLNVSDNGNVHTFNLGTIATVDTEAFNLNAAGVNTVGSVVNATLGQADANGLTAPALSATGTWNLTAGNNATFNLTIDGNVVFNAGGTLNLTNVDALNISGNVDLSQLNLTLTNVTTVNVPAGSTLTIAAEDASGLTITGAGTVNITDLEDTPAANLSMIMTATGDTGTVNAALDSTGDVTLTANLGIAQVTVSGNGTVDATGATIGPVDRNNPATADANDDTVPGFTMGAGSSLLIDALDAGDIDNPATAGTNEGWTMSVDGAGSVAVENLATNPDADLSGLTATGGVTAATNNVTFTGNLGTAVTTVNDGQQMIAAYSVVTGKTINEAVAPAAGTGTLRVEIPAASSAADLSTITSNMDAGQITANFTEDQTFTGNLNGNNATVGTGAADVDVIVSAAIVSGRTVTTTDADDSVHIPDLATNLAADLSGIGGAGAETAAFDANGTFTGDLGTVAVTIADGVTMTAAASVLIGANVNKSGAGANDGAVAVTMANSDANYDADNADGDANTATGTFEELDYNLTNLLSGATGVAADITSITVLDDLTFRGTLHGTVATSVADGATMTAAADVVDGKTVNAAGTTGAVAIDATTVTDGTLNLAGSAAHTVTNVTNPVTATGVTGALNVTTGATSVAIALGTGTNTVDANALTAGQTVSVTGADTSATVTSENGNIDASGVTDTDTDTTTGGVTLNGGDGQNTITGSANDDIINGGVDADVLAGGAGDDVYIIDAALDIVAGETITEGAGAGTDTVRINTASPIDLTLATTGNLEILDLTTGGVNANVTITGAQLDDFAGTDGLVQADSNDTLFIDTLTGLTLEASNASDTFVFAAADTGITIDNFNVANDTLALVNTAGVANGTAAGALVNIAGLAGLTNDDVVVDTAANLGANAANVGDQSAGGTGNFATGGYAFDTTNGVLYYDADGDFTAGVVTVGSIFSDNSGTAIVPTNADFIFGIA